MCIKSLQNVPQGSVLLGSISYGKVGHEGGKNSQNPVSYQVSYIVPPNKVVTVTYGSLDFVI